MIAAQLTNKKPEMTAIMPWRMKLSTEAAAARFMTTKQKSTALAMSLSDQNDNIHLWADACVLEWHFGGHILCLADADVLI